MGLIKALKWGSQFKKEDVYRPGCFNPGLFELDRETAEKLKPKLFSPLRTIFANSLDTWGYIGALLNDGDIQTAVVVSTDPLLVSCYSEDMDAVVLQYYPTELGIYRGWQVGTRLVATVKYNGFGTVKKNKDITPAPGTDPSYKSFGPIIADLYTNEPEYLARKKSEIPEALWERAMELGQLYMFEHPGVARNGLGVCFKDAVPIEKIKFDSRIRFD